MATGLSASQEDVPNQSLASSVEAELEAMIARGELRPGQHVNELALAKRFGVSRGPAREATRALERMASSPSSPTGAPPCATCRWTRRWRSTS